MIQWMRTVSKSNYVTHVLRSQCLSAQNFFLKFSLWLLSIKSLSINVHCTHIPCGPCRLRWHVSEINAFQFIAVPSVFLSRPLIHLVIGGRSIYFACSRQPMEWSKSINKVNLELHVRSFVRVGRECDCMDMKLHAVHRVNESHPTENKKKKKNGSKRERDGRK